MRIIVSIVGLLLISIGIGKYFAGIDTFSWHKTTGEITFTTVIQKGYVDSKATNKYAPIIRYRYTIDGKKYVGNRITLEDPSYTSKQSARNVLKNYLAGDSVDVFYDPRHNDRSVLIQGSPYAAIMLYIGLGLSLVLIGVFRKYLYKILYVVPFGAFSVLYNRKKKKRKRIYK